MAHDYGFVEVSRAALVQQHNMDVIANNLSNVSTPGFKGDRVVFSDLMAREIKHCLEQGPIQATENPLDVAIGGEGFFQVQAPNGVRLTRDGAFKMQSDGRLVTSEGFPVLGGGGSPITLNPNGGRPYIDDKGNISQNGEQVGKLDLVKVDDVKTMVKEGANLFGGPDGKPLATTPTTDAVLSQGYVEMANVQVVDEMVQMINSLRSYESYQKALQAMQEMDTKAVNQVGRAA
ncbi:MAG: flagellar hook-basal body protein [Pseudomonadota bacterium]